MVLLIQVKGIQGVGVGVAVALNVGVGVIVGVGIALGTSIDWAGGVAIGFAVVIDPGSAKDPVTSNMLRITTIRIT